MITVLATGPQAREVDGMLIEKNVEIPTRDGHVLRGDVYRPMEGPAVPALLSVSPYGKDLPMDQADPWEYRLCAERGPSDAEPGGRHAGDEP